MVDKQSDLDTKRRDRRYCIFSVHLNRERLYWYDPDYPIFYRAFETAEAREKEWTIEIVPNSREQPGLIYELAKVDVWGENLQWEKVEPPRYADSPIIAPAGDARRSGVIHCGPGPREPRFAAILSRRR